MWHTQVPVLGYVRLRSLIHLYSGAAVRPIQAGPGRDRLHGTPYLGIVVLGGIVAITKIQFEEKQNKDKFTGSLSSSQYQSVHCPDVLFGWLLLCIAYRLPASSQRISCRARRRPASAPPAEPPNLSGRSDEQHPMLIWPRCKHFASSWLHADRVVSVQL